MINKSHLFLRNEQGTSLYFDRTRGRDDSEEIGRASCRERV